MGDKTKCAALIRASGQDGEAVAAAMRESGYTEREIPGMVEHMVGMLRKFGYDVGDEIDVDGSFGPKTSQAAAEQSHDVGGICALIVLFRRNRHRQRARTHRPSRVFLRGWLARTDLLLQKITPQG